MPTIAFTFAGRKSHMRLQANFMRDFAGQTIDQWHVWDFSRNSDDKRWLDDEFGDRAVVLTGRDDLNYRLLCNKVIHNSIHTIYARSRSDAHVLIELRSGLVFEWVIGAFANSQIIIRKFTKLDQYKLHAPCDAKWNGRLEWNKTSLLQVGILDGHIIFGRPAPHYFNHSEYVGDDEILRVSVRTGFGYSGYYSNTNIDQPGVYLIKSDKTGYQGFRSVYEYYSDAFFSKCRFLKTDDDILLCESNSLIRMLADSEHHHPFDIVSANVINNGVCAFYQSKKGYFPGLSIDFPYPPEGVCGSLWNSAEQCASIHRY